MTQLIRTTKVHISLHSIHVYIIQRSAWFSHSDIEGGRVHIMERVLRGNNFITL